ncbi:MAG TPA: hypothetical protein VH479_03460 [Acidimicrobiales bacterium]
MTDVVLATGHAHVTAYHRTFDELVIRLQLWDESIREITARGVTEMHDTGTWESDALVRHPALDGHERAGYAIVDTGGAPTLTFAASDLDLGEAVRS